MNKLQQPEVVEDGNLFTTRLRVPGGWMYRSYDKSSNIMCGVFVPEPIVIGTDHDPLSDALTHLNENTPR